jgi:hypothetical protein
MKIYKYATSVNEINKKMNANIQKHISHNLINVTTENLLRYNLLY